jgi:phage tail P2-like protein
MVDLVGTPFGDLLPSSVASDPQFVAAAATLDAMFAETDAQVQNVLIWSRLDEITEPELSSLAWQVHLDGFEGYALATSDAQKQALIAESFRLHMYKGTRWSLERIFTLLGMTGTITEWWEAIPPFNPYEFDIEVDAASHTIDQNFYDSLFQMIDALKNVRSHLRNFKVSMSNTGSVPVVASTAMLGLMNTIYPFELTDFTVAYPTPVIGAGYQAIWTIRLLPYAFTLADFAISHPVPYMGSGYQSTWTMKTTPVGST